MRPCADLCHSHLPSLLARWAFESFRINSDSSLPCPTSLSLTERLALSLYRTLCAPTDTAALIMQSHSAAVSFLPREAGSSLPPSVSAISLPHPMTTILARRLSVLARDVRLACLAYKPDARDRVEHQRLCHSTASASSSANRRLDASIVGDWAALGSAFAPEQSSCTLIEGHSCLQSCCEQKATSPSTRKRT